MPLFYYARQSQIATKEGVKTWHLSLKKVGKVVDTQLLAQVFLFIDSVEYPFECFKLLERRFAHYG